MCTDKIRRTIAPKTFLCCINLKAGCLCIGIVFAIIEFVMVITTAIQTHHASKELDKATFSVKNNYSYAIVAVLYTLTMFCVNLWFIWGVIKEKSSVVLSWLVIHTIWLSQTFCILLVLICLHAKEAPFLAWILSLVFGLLFIGILMYCLLVVLGYWIELIDKKKTTETQ